MIFSGIRENYEPTRVNLYTSSRHLFNNDSERNERTRRMIKIANRQRRVDWKTSSGRTEWKKKNSPRRTSRISTDFRVTLLRIFASIATDRDDWNYPRNVFVARFLNKISKYSFAEKLWFRRVYRWIDHGGRNFRRFFVATEKSDSEHRESKR